MAANLSHDMSGSIRLFVDAPLSVGSAFDATPNQAHYLGAVMRRAPGDEVRVFNGREGEWRARIVALRKDRGSLEAISLLRDQAHEPDLWLAFALLKRDATDLVVEKATELGVSAILPLITDRTNAARVNLGRLRSIAVEAAEQCERLTVPRVEEPVRLYDLLGSWPPGRHLVAAIERSAAPPPLAQKPSVPSALLVGPEGGFTGAELDVLGATPFLVKASLGPRVLRAETAAIVGLALIQAPAGG